MKEALQFYSLYSRNGKVYAYRSLLGFDTELLELSVGSQQMTFMWATDHDGPGDKK
jgi:hypothetical protein